MDPDMLLMCEMLQGYLQQPEQSQQQQQRGGPSEQQPLQARAAEEEVSGMLQALQIEGLPAQAMAQPDLLPQLGAQKSVGAHLLADLLSQQQQQGTAAGVQRAPSAARAALASAAAASQQQQQQQRGQDEPSLPGFSGGLLRLTTPNSAIIGAALDSPGGARPGSGQWWAELPTAGNSPPAGGAQERGQQQQLPAAAARPGGQRSNAAEEEDLSALMTMWGSGDA
jgi:hypothetical protein